MNYRSGGMFRCCVALAESLNSDNVSEGAKFTCGCGAVLVVQRIRGDLTIVWDNPTSTSTTNTEDGLIVDKIPQRADAEYITAIVDYGHTVEAVFVNRRRVEEFIGDCIYRTCLSIIFILDEREFNYNLMDVNIRSVRPVFFERSRGLSRD